MCYYYYKNCLRSFDHSSNLIDEFKNPVNNDKVNQHFVMTIAAQAVEADPDNTFVAIAWDVPGLTINVDENGAVSSKTVAEYFIFN